MTIERIERGKRMSQAVIHGDVVWLAGQVGDPAGDIEAQTTSALAAVEAQLAKAGSSKARILQMTVWLADMDDFARMNVVYDAWIDPENPPARACGEARLATPDYKVEFIAVAAR